MGTRLDAFGKACESLHRRTLDYEVKAALQRIESDPPERCSPEVTLVVACHDEQEAVDPDALEARVRGMLHGHPESTRRALLRACTGDAARVAHWPGETGGSARGGAGPK